MTTLPCVRGSKVEISPGVWRLRVYTGRRPNGTPIQITKTVRAPERRKGAGSRLADNEMAKMLAAVDGGRVTTTSVTVSSLLDQWFEHLEAIGRSPTTLRKYRSIADTVLRPELGHVKLNKLTARQLDALYAKLTAKGNKPTTVRRVHALLSAALHQAERWDLVARSVARRATPPPIHAEQAESPSPDEVRALVAAAEELNEPGLATLLLLAALTGARRGELCALRWIDIDWDQGVVRIGRSVYETEGGGWDEKPTKTHQVRRIGLDALGLAALRRHRATCEALAQSLDLNIPPDAFMFSRSPQGTEPIRPDLVSKFTVRAAKRARVDTHLHALRHFSATQLIAGGHDVRTVAGRLGHADASITLRVYSHVLPERDREAAEALGQMLAPKAPNKSGPRTKRRERISQHAS